jgi:spermidine/putrescine transport system permease protein
VYEEKMLRRLFSGRRLLQYFTILVYIFLFVPIIVVILMAFHPKDIPSFPMPGYSLRWFRDFFHNYELLNSLRISITLGVVASLISGIIGTLTAFAIVRAKMRGKEFLNTLIFAPMLLSGVVIGVALLSFFRLIHFPVGFLALTITHVLLTIPFVVVVVSARLAGFDRSIEEAAMNLGANRIQTLGRITLPIIAPGIIGGMLLAFTISFDEFPATQFLATFSPNTIPIRVFGMIRPAITPQINVLATVMVCITIGLPLLGHYIIRKKSFFKGQK